MDEIKYLKTRVWLDEYQKDRKDISNDCRRKEIDMLKRKICALEELIARITRDLPEYKEQLINYIELEFREIRLQEENDLKEIDEYRTKKREELDKSHQERKPISK